MTAREQARTAAKKLKSDFPGGLIRDAFYEKVTDAASDVWEPILRRLMAVVESRLESIAFAAPEMVGVHMGEIHKALARAKEALGEE